MRVYVPEIAHLLSLFGVGFVVACVAVVIGLASLRKDFEEIRRFPGGARGILRELSVVVWRSGKNFCRVPRGEDWFGFSYRVLMYAGFLWFLAHLWGLGNRYILSEILEWRGPSILLGITLMVVGFTNFKSDPLSSVFPVLFGAPCVLAPLLLGSLAY